MCNYHMLVGTIYMCPKKEDRGAKDILDFSSKLNCIV